MKNRPVPKGSAPGVYSPADGSDAAGGGKWTLTKRLVEQYQFNGPHGGWAIITLDPRGIFQAVSDFGEYAYDGWGHHGCESFKHFLVTLRDHDYFLGKVADGMGQRFDFDRTIREYRHRLLERRREDGVSREPARTAWDEIADFARDHTSDPTAFVYEFAERCPGAADAIFDGDRCGMAESRVEDWPPIARRFYEEVFRGQLVPVLLAEIAPRTPAAQPEPSSPVAPAPPPARGS